MLSTRKKLVFLNEYLLRWYKKWNAIHPSNIAGFRIDKKMINGKKGRFYSIVFQVKKKKDDNKLNKDKRIPKFLRIKFPDGKFRKISTDVDETGTFKFQVGACRKRMNNGHYNVGTAGLFVEDGAQNIYAITNYHVVAWDRMERGKFSFEGKDGENLTVHKQPAVFVEGILSREMDAAFVYVPNPPLVPLNKLPNGTSIRGYKTGPISLEYRGKRVKVFSPTKEGVSAQIKSVSTNFNTGFRNVWIEQVIAITLCTSKGDSGAAVLDGVDILGIVTGADDKFTYVIPYYKIRDFKPLDIV